MEAGEDPASSSATFGCTYGAWSTWVHYYNARGNSWGCSAWEIDNNYCVQPAAMSGGQVSMRSLKYTNNFWVLSTSANTDKQANSLCNASPDYWHLATFQPIGSGSYDGSPCTSGGWIARSQLRLRAC
jgi:hypothetical protein